MKPNVADELRRLKLAVRAIEIAPPGTMTEAQRATELRTIRLAIHELSIFGEVRTLLPSEIAECRQILARQERQGGSRIASFPDATVHFGDFDPLGDRVAAVKP